MQKLGFKCVKCHHAELDILEADVLCPNCNARYPILNGVYDFLGAPSPDVIKEITGMALENGYSKENYMDFRVKTKEVPKTLDQKIEMTKEGHNQYYLQTKLNFDQAKKELGDDFKGKRVLEIGACYDYYFLSPFKDQGAECFGLNLHYHITEEQEFKDFPVKVIGDMNLIPFVDQFFDVVIISATSHHSNTPEVLVDELYRVLKHGGHCLMINDPIDGLLKNIGSVAEYDRHDHINENEYGLIRYNKMFKKSGFKYKHLFSDYYDQKLLKAKIHPDTRFALIASLVAGLWKISAFRWLIKKYFLSIAQLIFGFPLNVVLYKR